MNADAGSIFNADLHRRHVSKEGKMGRVHIIIVIASLLFSLVASAEDKQTPMVMTKIEPLPRDLEIQLALSALPPQLRDNATVYVLNPDKGFEVARKGTNGFHTFVARTGDDAMQGAWPLTKYPEDILYPVSFDNAGARANMRVFFDIERCRRKELSLENSRDSSKNGTKQDITKHPNKPDAHTCCLQSSELT
jgi:hypothetical protein